VIRWRRGVVTAVRREWPGAAELDVSVAGAPLTALAYPRLTGRPEPGDEVLLNTSALDLGLGTGGYALVVDHGTETDSRVLDLADEIYPGTEGFAAWLQKLANAIGVLR